MQRNQCTLVSGFIRQSNDNIQTPQELEELTWQMFDNMRSFSVGDRFDCRDRFGAWNAATIILHKTNYDQLSIEQRNDIVKHKHYNKRNYKQTNFNGIYDLDELNKFEAIFVHCDKWGQAWDEWIFFDYQTLFCDCIGKECKAFENVRYEWEAGYHRLAKLGRYTELRRNKNMIHMRRTFT